jgi:hypothetical protein
MRWLLNELDAARVEIVNEPEDLDFVSDTSAGIQT